MCWNAAWRMPVLDFVLVTQKMSGVPIFQKGSPFNWGIWESGVPIFTGSPKFYDTGIEIGSSDQRSFYVLTK